MPGTGFWTALPGITHTFSTDLVAGDIIDTEMMGYASVFPGTCQLRIRAGGVGESGGETQAGSAAVASVPFHCLARYIVTAADIAAGFVIVFAEGSLFGGTATVVNGTFISTHKRP